MVLSTIGMRVLLHVSVASLGLYGRREKIMVEDFFADNVRSEFLAWWFNWLTAI